VKNIFFKNQKRPERDVKEEGSRLLYWEQLNEANEGCSAEMVL
jgi:hypothetical protein